MKKQRKTTKKASKNYRNLSQKEKETKATIWLQKI